eukprot:gene12669-16879_t
MSAPCPGRYRNRGEFQVLDADGPTSDMRGKGRLYRCGPHGALEAASSRRHEYATLEHLLLALIDDEHGSKVMTACGVDTAELKINPRLTSSLFGRGLAKQRTGATAEGELDINNAKAMDPNIVKEFASYGVR